MVPVAWPWRMGKRVEMAISVDAQGFEQKFNQFNFASSTVIVSSSVFGFMRSPAITKPIPIITEIKAMVHNINVGAHATSEE